MKMKSEIIICLLSIILVTAQSKIECRRQKHCLCFPNGPEYEFQCPPNYIDTNTGMLIHFHNTDRTLSIDCTELKEFDGKLLPPLKIGHLDEVSIRLCPINQNTFRTIIDTLSITNLTELKCHLFDNLNNTVITKDYFKGLESLQSLSITSGGISMMENDVFSYMTMLKALDLSANNVSLKPNMFVNMSSLNTLFIAENRLAGLPNDVFRGLSNLQTLYLWNNQLTELNDNHFHDLSSLALLELSKNQIANMTENSLKFMEKLTSISLARNNLSEIPDNLFKYNKKLKTIRISFNPNLRLTSLLFSNLPLLEQVNLEGCNLELIPENAFEGSIKLESLILRNNKIKGLSENLFRGLVNLRELHLSENQLEELPTFLFKPLEKLESLYLQDNLIKTISEQLLSGLINVKEVNLGNNQIHHIHHRAFDTNSLLTKLVLAHNKYTPDPKTQTFLDLNLLSKCRYLEDVDFSDNNITDMDYVISTFNKINLTSLDLSFNKLESVIINNFQAIGFKKLIVNLSNNSISKVYFPSTEILASSSELDARSYPAPGAVIYLDNNPIKCDCQNYNFLRYIRGEMIPEVKVLFDIHTENVSCSSPPALKDFPVNDLKPQLLVCPLDEVIENYSSCAEDCLCFWRPVDKTVLVDCANRNLTSFPNINFPKNFSIFNQTELHLEGNRLSDGLESYLRGYRNVTRLNLSHNMIHNLTWLPPKLKSLKLDHNQISYLPFDILNQLNKSNVVDLSFHHNPWMCDCQMQNFTEFLRQHSRQMDTSLIKCKDSRKLIDLNKNDLCHDLHLIYIIPILVTIVLLLFAIAAALFYRFEQEIKVWLFAKNLCLWWVTEEELDKEKTYDAFISYSHKDEDFVVQNLLPVLEGGPQPYKLCLHYRNWVPGEFIAKQVADSVCQSRRTMVILSSNFLSSVWGKMEFRTAHIQAMQDGRARVIIVLFGDVDLDSLDEELTTYLKINTYVKWGDPYFWNKLRYALPHARKNVPVNNQKHANVMSCIDDKFNLVSTVNTNSVSTPPVLSMDSISLQKFPLNSIDNNNP